MRSWAAIIGLCCMLIGGAVQAVAGGTRVLMQTSMGDITLELDRAKAPASVDNFLAYARVGHYDGTIFHRVIPGFMIQGGGFDPSMRERVTRAPIVNEADNGLRNDRSTIAMARTSDPNSATTQFFINLKDNDFLNFRSRDVNGWGYAVFGRVVGGMDVVDAIADVRTTTMRPFADLPVEPVIIKKVTIE